MHRRNDTSGSVGAGAGNWRASASDEDFILEGWSEGFMVGALVIMACITIANMRRKVLLHKLILVEVSCLHPAVGVQLRAVMKADTSQSCSNSQLFHMVSATNEFPVAL